MNLSDLTPSEREALAELGAQRDAKKAQAEQRARWIADLRARRAELEAALAAREAAVAAAVQDAREPTEAYRLALNAVHEAERARVATRDALASACLELHEATIVRA